MNKQNKIKEKIAKNGKVILAICSIIIIMVVYLMMEFGGSTEVIIEDEASNFNNSLPYEEKEISEMKPTDSFDAAYKDSISNANNNGSYSQIRKKDSLNSVLKKLNEMSFENTEPIADNSNIGGGVTRQSMQPEVDPYLQAQKEELARERRAMEKERKELAKREAAEELRRQKENITNKGNDFFSTSSNDNVINDNSFGSNRTRSKSIMDKGPTNDKILASVKNDQIVKQGERVTLVLEDDAIINGVLYPRNTKVYGIVSFSKNRVRLSIAKINHDVVDMFVEDAQDGLEGIYVEGANIIGEGISESVGDGLNQVNVGNVPVGGALRNLLRKKNKEVKVQLLNDYYVLLKPNL